MADENNKETPDATEFLSGKSEPLVPKEPLKEDEAGPDFRVEPPKKPEPKKEIPKKLEKEPKKIGAPIPGKLDKLKRFWVECKRVLRVTKKPDREEFIQIVKVSAIGMAIIGAIGFLVFVVDHFLFG